VEILVAVAIIVGLVGVVVPVVPGLVLAGGAVSVWAAVEQQWWLLAIAVLLTILTTALRLAIPARTARDAASTWALAVGAVAALAGMFVIPVIGAIVGFLVGVFGTEVVRMRQLGPAWQATWTTTKSLGVTMALELASILILAALWVTAVVVVN
jgi:uncharacterized protein YqgC (DUF456 family)